MGVTRCLLVCEKDISHSKYRLLGNFRAGVCVCYALLHLTDCVTARWSFLRHRSAVCCTLDSVDDGSGSGSVCRYSCSLFESVRFTQSTTISQRLQGIVLSPPAATSQC